MESYFANAVAIGIDEKVLSSESVGNTVKESNTFSEQVTADNLIENVLDKVPFSNSHSQGNSNSSVQEINEYVSETVENTLEISSDAASEPIILETIDITLEKSEGVRKQIIKPGEGEEYPGYGDRVIVHYTGWLLNKEKPIIFDSNRKDEKSEFSLGRGVVIKGWDLGISTMKKGEVALFIIQPQYAYGDMGNPPTIPALTPLLFEIELYGWKLDDLSHKKDGGILRKVIEQGEGTTSPNEGALVKGFFSPWSHLEGFHQILLRLVKLVGYFQDKVFEDCEKEFILGEGCLVDIPDGVEIAIFKFSLKEKSLIYLKNKYGFEKGLEEFGIPPEADVMYEVILLSFEKAKDVWEMNTDEKYEKAKISKEKGISFIQSGNFKVALRHFRWILACLEKEPGVDSKTEKSRSYLLLSGYLNIVLCLLKLENYLDAIKFCDKALEMDPKNEKAIFRRGQARMFINDCQEALRDFETLCSLYPDNKAAKQCIIICQERIKKQTLKDKSIYNKMFEKFKKQDQERMKNMKTETGVWQDEDQEEKDLYMSETQRLIERNNSFLRDANIIELSNTAC